jgi:hypothetical protein
MEMHTHHHISATIYVRIEPKYGQRVMERHVETVPIKQGRKKGPDLMIDGSREWRMDIVMGTSCKGVRCPMPSSVDETSYYSNTNTNTIINTDTGLACVHPGTTAVHAQKVGPAVSQRGQVE